jgi:hypothetical protein
MIGAGRATLEHNLRYPGTRIRRAAWLDPRLLLDRTARGAIDWAYRGRIVLYVRWAFNFRMAI